jgi:dipeptidyl aminopeptidase/acylaminoacyl peptidase
VPLASVLYLINSDGTGLTAVASGTDPAWSPDAKRLAYLGPDNAVYVVNVGGHPRPQRITPTDVQAEWPLAWSPDGQKIAYTGSSLDNAADEVLLNASPVLYVSDTHATSPNASTWDVSGGQPDWSPDYRHIAYMDTEGDIDEIDVATGDTRTLVQADNVNYSYPVWSPHGGYLAYAEFPGDNTWSILIRDPDGTAHVIQSGSPNEFLASTLVWSRN